MPNMLMTSIVQLEAIHARSSEAAHGKHSNVGFFSEDMKVRSFILCTLQDDIPLQLPSSFTLLYQFPVILTKFQSYFGTGKSKQQCFLGNLFFDRVRTLYGC